MLTRFRIQSLTNPRPSRSLASQNLIFRLLQSQQRIQVWLYDNANAMIEGRLIGFDEYMNLVLDDCEEIRVKKDARTSSSLGRILLKGDNISLLAQAPGGFLDP